MNFNGFDFSSLLIVEDIMRSVMPPTFPEGINIPGNHGLRFSKSNVGPNIIIVKCRIIKDTRFEMQSSIRDIARKLYTEKPKKLVLKDEPNLFNIAIVTGTTDVEKLLYTGYFEIVFECMDPFAYGPENTYHLNSTFENKGSSDTFGLIEFKPNAGVHALIELSHLNFKRKLMLIHSFNGTEKVHIDLAKQQIKINNNNALQYLTLDSDFFMIPPGEDININVTGVGTITLRERWI